MSSLCGKRLRQLLTVSALAVLAACSDYNQAQQAYQAGDHKLAFERFEKLAKSGDVRAMLDLAQMYSQGIGRDPDPEMGWLWLRQAANAGNAAAMLEMGMRYESGIGAEQNFVMALTWYKKASTAGNAVARFNIATMYMMGQALPKDPVHAYAWFRFAKKAGSSAAIARMQALEKTMTPAEVEQAKALAEKLETNPDS